MVDEGQRGTMYNVHAAFDVTSLILDTSGLLHLASRCL